MIARCSPSQLKITLHHKTRRTDWGWGVGVRGEAFSLFPPFFPSVAHYPASLTKSHFSSPSFIISTLTSLPPICSPSIRPSVSGLRFPPEKLRPPWQPWQRRLALQGRLNTGSRKGGLCLLGGVSVPVKPLQGLSHVPGGRQSSRAVFVLQAGRRCCCWNVKGSCFPPQKPLGCLCP